MNKEMIRPVNSVLLTEDEMRDIKGGVRVAYMDSEVCKAIAFGICGSLVGVSAAALAVSIDAIAVYIAATVPGLGWVTGAILAGYAIDFSAALTKAVINEKGLAIDIEGAKILKFTVE